MYSTVEDLYRWNQALSTSPLFTAGMREQIFLPGLGDWGCGWFIHKLPPGSPGAGSTMAEMRGDLPGNYFSWILRYLDLDAAIIVLRNGYGSTERLEQNLQAVLFGQAPRLPRKSPKDILAHGLLVTYAAVTTHWELSLAASLLLSVLGLRQITNRAAPRLSPA